MPTKKTNQDQQAPESAPQQSIVSTTTTLQLLLIPLCLLGAWLLPVQSLSPRDRFKIAFVCWALLTSGTAIASGIYKDLNKFVARLFDPDLISRKWMAAQVRAWLGAICFASIVGASYYYLDIDLKPEDVRDGFNPIVAGAMASGACMLAALYFFALTRMPRKFYEETEAGQKILRFLSATSPDPVRSTGTVGVVLCSVLAIFIAILPFFIWKAKH